MKNRRVCRKIVVKLSTINITTNKILLKETKKRASLPQRQR